MSEVNRINFIIFAFDFKRMKTMRYVSLPDGDFGILKKYTMLFDGEVAFFHNSANGVGDDAVKLEWVMVVMVVSGSLTCNINEDEVHLRAHDLLMLGPSFVISQRRATDDFHCKCMCFSKSILEKLVNYSFFNWDIMSFLILHPVLTLSDKEYELFVQFYSLFELKLDHQNTACYREAIQSLVQSFLYELCGVLDRYVPVGQKEYSLGRNLFKGFLDVISASYPKPRSVSYYAERLNVTPKYLSTVCKQYCGETASTLINRFVMKDISYLLAHSDKSIKEIMVELDFPSLSFFGKYVKKHFGMGPRELRATKSS